MDLRCVASWKKTGILLGLGHHFFHLVSESLPCFQTLPSRSPCLSSPNLFLPSLSLASPFVDFPCLTIALYGFGLALTGQALPCLSLSLSLFVFVCFCLLLPLPSPLPVPLPLPMPLPLPLPCLCLCFHYSCRVLPYLDVFLYWSSLVLLFYLFSLVLVFVYCCFVSSRYRVLLVLNSVFCVSWLRLLFLWQTDPSRPLLSLGRRLRWTRISTVICLSSRS